MRVIDTWTGQEATALQRAFRLSNEAFAARLGIAVRTVANWHAKPAVVPVPVMQQILDTAHRDADEDERARFAQLLPPDPTALPSEPGVLDHVDQDLINAIDWLDEAAELPDGTTEALVASRLAELDPRTSRRIKRQRSKVGRSALADAVAGLYPTAAENASLYQASTASGPIRTTMLVQPDWVAGPVPLGSGQDQFDLDRSPIRPVHLDDAAHAAASNRVAEIVATGSRFFDAQLYALTGVTIDRTAGISGTFQLGQFREYALTTDLIATELVDGLVSDRADWSSLPLRSRYLPTPLSALDLGSRRPAGGVLSLFAAARPASRTGWPADYVLLIQERSGQVVNANGQLAVIPKAFHQPLVNYADDAHLSMTLQRELEEELLGRDDLELGGQGVADPIHPSRLSEPMRWLMEHQDPAIWQMECTGFGVNLLTGNYEFAALTAIHDEHWWGSFGGDVLANWEANHLQQYSARDTAALLHLIQDDRWSNEGLFALLRGLLRLSEVGGDRTAIPNISEEI
ncbi:hypothetical protein BKA15_005565 [Microlunatus parietis]|uniref:Uncharacterized protein n=1 Tax=Microlunatus parietis TaxID=682979 RepID=A0A7Y9LFL0_9ACTN|nr:hypothetical protein [Microlunatus parietis]NYE74236.1 hypothetical protein [Microlunatus parietis]